MDRASGVGAERSQRRPASSMAFLVAGPKQARRVEPWSKEGKFFSSDSTPAGVKSTTMSKSKGSLAGKSTRNYRFSSEDTEAIRNWIRQSLLVNFVVVEPSSIDDIEEALIRKYCPLVNIAKNPAASAELSAARDNCVAYAKSK